MADVTLVEDIFWSYDGGSPRAKTRRYFENVDPFPCYHHDLKLVNDVADVVAQSFPIDPLRGPKWGVFAFETLGRTNAWCSIDYDYDNKDEEGIAPWYISIGMLGKRTPLHPAMTRFIVAHEYGHGVEAVIERAMDKTKDGILREYAERRGLRLGI
jgi:hypothetical protein